MDEPTTALTNKEITILFEIMRNLKEHGLSIIFISHKMPELFEICDKYYRSSGWLFHSNRSV